MNGKSFSMVVFLFLALIIVSAYFYTESANEEKSNLKPEGFSNVLGALAPYKSHLVQCIKECNRESPDNRLLESGNFNCSIYCESVLTDNSIGICPNKLASTT